MDLAAGKFRVLEEKVYEVQKLAGKIYGTAWRKYHWNPKRVLAQFVGIKME